MDNIPQQSHRVIRHTDEISLEKHYSIQDLVQLWSLSAQTIRRLFQDEPEVVAIGSTGHRKRRYVTLRIPESVAQRVHRRLRKADSRARR